MTVDKPFPKRDRIGMPPPESRRSRFTDASFELVPLSDEIVPPDERARREASRISKAAFSNKSKEERAREHAARKKVWDLHEDEEVRNDAVAGIVAEVDGWSLKWVFAEQNGSLVASALHLEPTGRATPPGGITSNLLRELSPSAAVVAATTTKAAPGSFTELALRWAKRDREDFGPTAEPRKRKGRPRIPDTELAQIASAYLAEISTGAGVTRRLAQRFQIAEDTVRDRIRMCRDREFLGGTARGRRGGVPGPRLLELMQQEREREDPPR